MTGRPDGSDPADGSYAGSDADGTGTLDALLSGARIGQFVSVGVVGFCFDVTTSTALRELGVFPELAAFVGIEVAVVVMFLLNDRFTFSGEGRGGLGATARRLARSNLVRLGGIVVQLVTFSAVYRGVPITLSVAGVDGWFVVARGIGIGAGMVVNYVAESVFTWRVLE